MKLKNAHLSDSQITQLEADLRLLRDKHHPTWGVGRTLADTGQWTPYLAAAGTLPDVLATPYSGLAAIMASRILAIETGTTPKISECDRSLAQLSTWREHIQNVFGSAGLTAISFDNEAAEAIWQHGLTPETESVPLLHVPDLGRYACRFQFWQNASGDSLPAIYGPGVPAFASQLEAIGGTWHENATAICFNRPLTKNDILSIFPESQFVRMPAISAVKLQDEHPVPVTAPWEQATSANILTAARLLKIPVQKAGGISNYVAQVFQMAPIFFDDPMHGKVSRRQAQEAIEAAMVARLSDQIAFSPALMEDPTLRTTRMQWKKLFQQALETYEHQPTMDLRSSESVRLQQFSTPLPLALASQLITGVKPEDTFFEPTIGHGALAVMASKAGARVVGYELDENRVARAENILNGAQIHHGDATRASFQEISADVVVSNPPFGELKTQYTHPKTGLTIPVTRIDRLIALRALERLKDNGRAVLILGADSYLQKDGEVSDTYTRFLNFLHDHYQVVDQFAFDGRLYERQGASFPIRVIAIHGTGKSSLPVPTVLPVVRDWDSLFERSYQVRTQIHQISAATPDPEAETEAHVPEFTGDFVNYGNPGSKAPNIGTVVPKNMAASIFDALKDLQSRRGDIDAFVGKQLGWHRDELHQYLGAEQIDSVALGIDNVMRGKGMIIGDQTGVGKGRQMAALVRWSILQGQNPVFMTEKANLFDDLVRDIRDINSLDLIKPLVLNGDVKVTDDKGRTIVESASPATIKEAMQMMDGELPENYNCVFLTYSQICQNPSKSPRAAWMYRLAVDNMLMLDESHNAGGDDSNTGRNVQIMVDNAKGVIYSSATFAKRPENLAVYRRTDLFKGQSVENVITAIMQGGPVLQEVISSMLAQNGQYIRREHPFKVKANFFVLEEDSLQHRAQADLLSSIYRRFMAISGRMKNLAKAMDKALKKEIESINEKGESSVSTALDIVVDKLGKKDSKARNPGVDSTNFASVIWNINAQFLLALKVESEATRAINSIKSGEKPVIVVDNTMETFLREYRAHAEQQQEEVDPRSYTFRNTLYRKLEGMLALTVTDRYGNQSQKLVCDPVAWKSVVDLYRNDELDTSELSDQQREEFSFALMYWDLKDEIDKLPDLPASPIDAIRARIRAAGYTIDEVTGRSLGIDYETGTFFERSAKNRTQTIRGFNDGSTDAIIINRSGSTGISLHASEKFLDQRKRHMKLTQPSLDINQVMQTLGRVYRTGSVVDPEYTFTATDLPMERRPMNILRNKLASLSANTKSDQDDSVIEIEDILNSIGDRASLQVLMEYPQAAHLLDIHLDEEMDKVRSMKATGLARKLTGRIAILPINKMPGHPDIPTQDELYDSLDAKYRSIVADLQAKGISLGTHIMDVKATEVSRAEIEPASGPGVFEQGIDLIQIQYQEEVKPVPFAELWAAVKSYRDVLNAEHHLDPLNPLANINGMSMSKGIHKSIVTKLKNMTAYAKIAEMNPDLAIKNAVEKNSFIEQEFSMHQTALRLETMMARLSSDSTLMLRFTPPNRDGELVEYALANLIPKDVKDVDLHNPDHWRVTLVSADPTERILRLSLHDTLALLAHSQASNNVAGLFIKDTEDLHISFHNDRQSGLVDRFDYMMTGNLVNALNLARSMRMGRPVMFTDHQGLRHRAILMPRHFEPDMLDKMPVRLPDAEVASQAALAGITVGNSISQKHTLTIRYNANSRDTSALVMCEGTKSVGGKFFLDQEIVSLLDDPAEGFQGGRSEKSARISLQSLPALIKLLVEEKGETLYIDAEHREWVNEVVTARQQMGTKMPTKHNANALSHFS